MSEKNITNNTSSLLLSTKAKPNNATSSTRIDSGNNSSCSLHAVDQSPAVENNAIKTHAGEFTKLNCSFKISQNDVDALCSQLQNHVLHDKNIKLVANEVNIYKVSPAKNLRETETTHDGDRSQNTKAKVKCTIDMPDSITSAMCEEWKKDPKSHMDIDICIPAIKSSNLYVSVNGSTIYGTPNLSLYINKAHRLANSAVGTAATQSEINFNYPENGSKNLNTSKEFLHSKPIIEITSMNYIIPQSTSNNVTLSQPHKYVPEEGTCLSYKYLNEYNPHTKQDRVHTTQPLYYRSDAHMRSDMRDQPRKLSANRSDADRNRTSQNDSECCDCYNCCLICSLIETLLECVLECTRLAIRIM